jgi:phosphoglycolate phosphatase-like HAD superfamily hydrolase
VTVIGFDLDMTLVDSADAIVACVAHTCAVYGVEVDEDAVRATVGLPLDRVFPDLIPGVDYAEALEVYRDHYLSHGLAMQSLLAGAQEALEAVTRDGFGVVVISAKKDSHVRAVLDTVGLSHFVDEVVGERFAETKADALRERGALVYVGDHVGDVVGALGAGAVAVAVATGPTSRADLVAAGGDPVLDDLTEFVPWWESWVLARRDPMLHGSEKPMSDKRSTQETGA